MVVKNACSPQRIYGSYSQTLFLGLSVLDFSCSVGWNEQFTTCTINLVKDPCAGYRKVLNHNTLSLEEIEFLEGDPGFLFDEDVGVGTPAFFKVENFEFAGIIQSYTYQESSNGFTYTITLISPGIVLEAAQLILGKYTGPVQLVDSPSMSNIFNVYGFLESLGDDCGLLISDDCATFGSLAGGFGNAEKTDRGIPWTLVKKAIQVLLGGLTTDNPFSPHSAMVLKAGTGQYGSIKNRYYLLDISEVPLDTELNGSTGGGAPTNPNGDGTSSGSYKDYRIASENMSVLELLSTVCRDAGYEFYVDLLPTRDNGALTDSGSDDKISNIIKIRTVERRNQPALGAISTFIQNQNANGKVVMQDSLGVEFASENNSAFLVGGQKYQLYQQFNPIYIRPYMGTNVNVQFGGTTANDVTLPPDYQWYYDFGAFPMPDSNSLISPPTAVVTLQNKVPESFFMMATADYTSWLNWTLKWYPWSYVGNYMWETLKARPISKPDPPVTNNDRDRYNNDLTRGLVPYSGGVAGAERDLKTLYQFYQGIAQEYLGTQFAIGIPFVCYDTDTDTGKTIWSDEPAPEGGWADALIGESVDITVNGQPVEFQCPVKTILGLDPASSDADFFKSDDGRIQCFAAFSLVSGVNISNLPAENYLIDPNGLYLWVKAEIEPQFKLTNFRSIYVSGTGVTTTSYAAAIIKLPGPVLVSPATGVTPNGVSLSSSSIPEELAGDVFNLRTGIFDSGFIAKADNLKLSPEKGLKVNASPLPFLTPFAVAIPVKSNTQTYGPWSAVAEVDGKVYYEQDEGLVPWEYGGMLYMNLAAQAKINNSICNVQTTERGSVTVAGYPEKSLGSDISENPISALDRNSLLKLGSYNSPSEIFNFKYLDLGGPQINKGAQITNINVTVGNEITTQYSLSSFTPTFGRFSKNNADRLKQIGQQKYKVSRALRDMSERSKLLQTLKSRTAMAAGLDIGKGRVSRSNSLLLIGKYFKSPTSLIKVPSAPIGTGVEISLEPTYYHSGIFPTSMTGLYQLPLTTGIARKEVTPATLSSLTTFADYDNTAFISWDGIFRPVMTYNTSETNNLPRENAPATNWSKPSNPVISESPAGPLTRASSSGVTRSSYIGYTGLAINNAYLRFIGNPSGFGSLEEPATRALLGNNIGHDIEMVGRSNAATMTPIGDLTAGLPPNDATKPNTDATDLCSPYAIQEAYFSGLQGYNSSYRFMALRGPLYVQGWGYDIMGKPVPNQWESNNPGTGSVTSPGYNPGSFKAYSGLHRTDYSGLSDKFYPGYLGDANTWPAGPVDLRWDRRRGVWTIPHDFRLYLANIYRPMSGLGGSSRAMVLNANDVYDSDGKQPDSSGYKNIPWEITVYNPYNFKVPAGYGMVYYSHESGQYWPIMGPCGCEPTDPQGTGFGCCQQGDRYVDGMPCVDLEGNVSEECDPPSGPCALLSQEDCDTAECLHTWNGSTWELTLGCGDCNCEAVHDYIINNTPPPPGQTQLASLCVPCGQEPPGF